MARTSANQHSGTIALPRIDNWLVNGFEQFFLPRYLRKHFHAMAVNSVNLAPEVHSPADSLVLYANHAGWWDPMVAMFIHRRLMTPGRRMYAPIDAMALARYRIFNRMGFYGIETHSPRAAVQFLQPSLRILQQPKTTVALTPEGRFCDVRDSQQPLMPGLAHLANAIENSEATQGGASRCVWFVPAAIEYCFWEERLPECLCWFGPAMRAEWGRPSASKAAWQSELTTGLRSAQRALSVASIARDSSQFEILLSGCTGTWRPYDAARRLAARMRGKSMDLQHGAKLSNRRSH